MNARPASTPAPAWRAIALLAVLVLFAHLLVLGLLPGTRGPEPLPLEGKFITRTIVIAPPARPGPVAEAVPARPSRPRPPAREPTPPSAAQPAAPTPPRPAASAAQMESAAPQAFDIDTPGAPADSPGPDTPDAQGGDPGSGTGAQGSGGGEGGHMSGAGQPLRIHGSVRLAFDLSGQRGAQPMSGAFGELVWLQDGQEYNARLSLRILFKTFLRWTSTGRLDSDGIAPLRFSETKRSETVSLLMRDEGRVAFGGDVPGVPLLAGAQDRLSVIVQLGALLAGDAARYPAGSRIALQTVGPRDAKVWVFQVGGEERIQVPAGEFTARHLERDPRQSGDYRLELWLAPELGYLPVQLRQVQPDGDFIELHLRDISTP